MKSRILSVLAASWLLGLGLALGKPQDGPPPLEGDAVDLYVFQEDRPVRVRLHLRHWGKAYQEAWDLFIDRLFAHLDVDGNGVLSKEELKNVPTPESLQLLLQVDYFSMPKRNDLRRSPELSVALIPDKVTRAGLARYYQLSGMEPLLAFAESRRQQAEAINDVILKQLDTDGDGKLSKKELLAAESRLRELDTDNDEALTREELVPVGPQDPMQRSMMQNMITPLGESQTVVMLKPGEPAGRLGFLLMNQYDKDQNQRLTAKKIALPEAVFKKLDADGDGELDLNELVKLPQFLPLAAEFVVEPGKALDAGDVKGRSLRSSELYWRLFTTGSEREYLTRTKDFYQDQFRRADVGRMGFLAFEQLRDHPTLSGLIPAADRNGDRKLTHEEMTEFLDLLERAIGSAVILTAVDLGKSWFDLLDTNQDGKLGIREWRHAWDALAVLDRNGDEVIDADELAPLLHLQIGTGQPGPRLQLGSGMVTNYDQSTANRSSQRGPLWFRKMDRNGDGYVSPREFLGTRQEFEKLDLDKDGFISPEEAEKAGQ